MAALEAAIHPSVEPWMAGSGPAMTTVLVVIPRNALGLIDLLILDRILQNHAGAHLADMLALNLLPRRLRGGVFVTARRFQRLAALGQLFIADQDVGRALVEIDTHPVAGLDKGQSAACRGFRRGVEDRG